MSMDSGDIYVNYSGVNDVEIALTDADKAVNQILDEVTTAVQPLVASWAGSSQEAYQQIQRKWSQDLHDMSTILSKYAPTLEEMRTNYSGTDNNLALQWADIQA